MSCPILSGYTLGCRDSVGGIEYIAIASHNSATVYTATASSSELISWAPTASFYKFEQYTEQGSGTQEGSYDNETGTGFVTQTITIVLEQMTTALRDQFLALTQARVRVIVKSQNGTYWLFGKVNGGRASASSSGPGKAMGDLAGFTLTLEFKEPEPATEIEETFALSLIV